LEINQGSSGSRIRDCNGLGLLAAVRWDGAMGRCDGLGLLAAVRWNGVAWGLRRNGNATDRWGTGQRWGRWPDLLCQAQSLPPSVRLADRLS